jgi:uncharacterized membrane protein YhaH (DUF805 family)
MLREVFGELRHGRIGRGRFAIWSVVIAGLFVSAGLALGFFAGVLEWLGLQPTTVGSKRATGLLALAIFLAGGTAMAFALLNLAAKRARDIGWHWLVGVLLLGALPGLGWLILALVPSRTWHSRTGAGTAIETTRSPTS